jgi:hypothetical protein
MPAGKTLFALIVRFRVIWTFLLMTGTAMADTPVANNQPASVVVNGEVFIALSWSDTGGHPRTNMIFTIVSSPTNGALESYNHRYSTTAYPDYYYYRSTNLLTGADPFTWYVSDGTLTSGVATCSVTVNPNSTPVANNQSVSTVQGVSRKYIWLNVGHSDSGQTMTYTLTTTPTNGILEYSSGTWQPVPTNTPISSQSWYYTPGPAFAGTVTFRWTVCDGLSTSAPGTCTITVSTNTAPQAQDLKLIILADTNVSRQVSYIHPDTDQTLTFQKLSDPSSGTLNSFSTSSGSFTYTPNPEFTGEDQFTWQVSDGIATSGVGSVKFRVHNVRDHTNILVDVIVDSVVLPEIQTEAQRLVDDLRNEGYTSRITAWSNSSAQAVWNHLRATYDGTNFLSGAILLGAVPVPQTDAGSKTDIIYWNMEGYITSWPSSQGEIWVSRLIATGNSFGDEATLLKRALDANHDYRTGQSRYLDTARAYAISQFDYDNDNVDSLTNLWTHLDAQIRSGFQPAWTLSGVLLQAGCHGNVPVYEGVTTDWIHYALAQVRYCVISACYCGAIGGVANNQTLTRGGGNVISVGATTTCGGDYVICSAGSPDTPFRDRLKLGECWGQSALHSYPWYGTEHTVVYGDLSLGSRACDPATGVPYPENQKPTVATFTASKTSPLPGEAVTFRISVTDSDAGSPHNPQISFDHQAEWFMNGHNYGRNDPTYVADDRSSSWTNVTHTFTNTGTYTVRAEIMDEWRARDWKEITITVNTPPVASNDTASVEANHSVTVEVLPNDSDPEGQAISLQSCAQPGHGTAAVSGNAVVYTSTNVWAGADTFAYTIRDTLNATASATVTVTVVADLTPPVLLTAACLGDSNAVTATFSEKMQPGTGANGAENPANYAIDHGATVSAAQLQADGKRVKLTTSTLGLGITYTLTVNNVGDLATPANAVAANSRASFLLVPKDPNLLAWWNLDETEGALAWDASGNGHTGTVSGAFSWTGAGRLDGALNLADADAKILVAPVVALSSDWTLCGWFKTPLPNTGTWHTMFRAQSGDHQIIADGSLKLGMYDNATGDGFRWCGFNLVTLSNGWHHVAAVGSGSTTAFYVDGAFVGTSDRKSSSDVYAVGNYQSGGQRFADRIDDVRVYNLALGAGEIAELAVRNGESLPDWWQVMYFGSVHSSDAWPLADPDHDGANNLHEWLAGTNPTNGASVFKFDSISNLLDRIGLNFPTVSGRFYTVEWNTNLLGTNWPSYLEFQSTANAPASVSFTNSLPEAFFRIRVTP